MKRILSLALAALLGLTGCAAPVCTAEQAPESSGGAQSAPGRWNPSLMALSEPVYPEFPQQPVLPEEGPEGAWEAYMDAYHKYTDALAALRGDDPHVTEAEHAALNAFAAKSVPQVLAGQEGKNAVYSPLSLWSALAMLAQCAEGESRQQLLDALGADSVESLQESVSQVWKGLYTDDGASSLLLANSIWLNSNLEGSYVQETLDALAQKYFSGAYAVPMGSGEADQAVTDWVKEQTHGLIGGGAPVVRTQADTLALLASSLYYRAGWTDEFLPERTQEDVFTGAAGRESRVDFMHRSQRANFLRREGYQAAQLGTRLGEMVFVLPDKGVSPESLLQDPAFLAGLDIGRSEDSHYGEVQWSVPKFDVDSTLGLLDCLRGMGITGVLDPEKADLSALTSLDAVLSDAKQLARVKVDEEGVEAAAVTMLMIETTSAMPEPDPEVCVMDLDRPFLFVIRSEGVPLFVGVVNQVE